MTTALPPTRHTRRLGLELRLTPSPLQDDAFQEAWVAFLSNRDPAQAVNSFVRRERRQRVRRLPGLLLGERQRGQGSLWSGHARRRRGGRRDPTGFGRGATC